MVHNVTLTRSELTLLLFCKEGGNRPFCLYFLFGDALRIDEFIHKL